MITEDCQVHLVKPVNDYAVGTVGIVVLVYPCGTQFEVEIEGWLIIVDESEIEGI
ncbi:hypothetical protein [Sphingobium sp. BS19]|uniref:hypothetical protein n=1 Tax=Sphingobium sp. BS19 TaxID=3018973 RepID=UPI002493C084|nr:hypothetical protein [Sphingobium sp. BS19]